MNYRSNSILAHIPQNRDGESILKQALFFTNALNMRIFLLDVIKSGPTLLHNPKSKRNQIRHQGALNRFTEFVKKCLGTDIPNNIILRIGWGKIVNTLIVESERGGYDFVMIDKSEHANNEHLSSAAVSRYVSKSYCPVLSVNKEYPVTEIKSIVVPIDISQHAKKRLYWATFFAKRLQAKIHIVSALNINIEERKSLAFKNAEKIKKMLEERGVKCEVKILKVHNQESHTAVLEYIEEVNAGMVIIRTHQESRFTGKKIGTFVSEIVHGCTKPVFTVGGVTQKYDMDSI
ncbi:universal stress protein [Draconibacterium sp. IB214405]|uniref:universal stress protein n=1 Tax=Draconibacterium sp. IB214405 TaxID=3097352 RepID=UPI002A0FCF8D|nr:universal stress protein [Draconibacterium sp. IB214405]MDX8339105.1 universal stress protein [Draconibacterium sp. IB214405]